VAPPQLPTGLRAIRYELSPIRRFKLKALREGLLGGNRPWLIAFVAYRSLIAVRRAVSRRQEHIATDVLKPGERIMVRAIPVSSGKERKRLLRGG
jgi:hypothetical protein